jgi:hypothetical protein
MLEEEEEEEEEEDVYTQHYEVKDGKHKHQNESMCISISLEAIVPFNS